MNDTQTIRERLRLREGDFTFMSYEFSDIKSSHSVLAKMSRDGEIVKVGTGIPTKRAVRPPNIYKVLQLKPASQVAKRSRTESWAKTWGGIYPEFFTLPDFGNRVVSIRSNRFID